MSERDEFRRILAEELKDGDTIYTSVVSVSRSGMSRRIECFYIRDNEPVNISYRVALALGWKRGILNRGVHVSGCGMDMGFHLVNCIESATGRTLHQRWL